MAVVHMDDAVQPLTRGRAPRQGGFTVVEMLTATVLFGIAIVMLTSLFELIQSSQRNATYFTVATHAARSEVERLKSSGYASLTNGNTYPFSLPDTLPPGSTGSVVVAGSSPTNAPDSKKIDVTVTYPIGSTNRTVTITAYVDPPGVAE